MQQRSIFSLAVVITIAALILSSFLPATIKPAYACYTWSVGQRVGLKGGTEIRQGPGFSYVIHTTLPIDANNWLVDIIDGPRYADGQEWWDISRVNIDGGGTGWVYIAQAGWDVCQPPPPGGNIYIASGLELVSDPNHAWPPYEGDKLIGRFTLGNNGGSAVHITGYGVRLRRNSTDYWDFLNTSAFDLQPGSTVRFDQNNERPLASGHYRAEITWQVDGGSWQVANAVEFDVAARPANIYIASGLELVSDPNHAWPPYEGDKLIGRFTLGNNGGSAVHITGYGVRLRRNSTDYWDFLNTSAFDLQPGSTVRFDQNNERPLASGHYRAEITWQVDGGSWQVANAVEFDVQAKPPAPSGHIVVENNDFSLSSDGSGNWPPSEGDKLIGKFTLLNDGTGPIHLDGLGIRLRRNGSENWDFLNMSGVDLASGQTVQFNQNNERPLISGHYQAEVTWEVDGVWYVTMSNDFEVSGTVSPPPIDPVVGSISLDNPLSISPLELTINENVQGSYRIHNSGSTTISIWRVGIGGRGPLGTDVYDFPWDWNVTLAPGQAYQFNGERNFDGAGVYTFFPVYQTNDYVWHEITFSNGDLDRVSINVKSEQPPDTGYKMLVDYEENSSAVLDVSRGIVTKEADGTFTFSNFKITNRSPLCREFRIKANGQDFQFGWRSWAVIMPFQTGTVSSINGLEPGYSMEIITNRQGSNPASSLIVGLCNIAAVAFATGTGDFYKPETKTVDVMYSLMNKMEEVAAEADIPIAQVEVIFLDFMGGKTKDGIFKLISFNIDHPNVLPILLKDWFGWTVEQGWLSFLADKLIKAWDSGWNAGIGGQVLWAMTFEKPLEARAVITPLAMPASSQFYPGSTSLSQSENSFLDEGLSGNGVNWAAIQNGGSIVTTSDQLSYDEQTHLIDSDLSTQWTSSASGDLPHQTTIELASGQLVYLTSIDILACSTSVCKGDQVLKTFHVDASFDNINYHTILQGEISAAELNFPKEFNVIGQKAQYIRLVMDSAQDGNSQVISTAEIIVYGTPGSSGDAFEPDSVTDYAYDLGKSGVSKSHNFSYPGDLDWFKFDAIAGQKYLIFTNGLGTSNDTYLELFDQDKQTLLSFNDDSEGNLSSKINWIAPADGTYYLLCRHYSPDRYGEGTSYNLTIQNVKSRALLPLVNPGNNITIGTTNIFGTVNFQGNPIAGITLELRFFDGVQYSTQAIATTQVNGEYRFYNVPNLSYEQSYYVRYLNGQNGNSEDSRFLWYWRSYTIRSTIRDGETHGGTFDLENVELLSPAHGTSIQSPYAFSWSTRDTSLSDEYEIDLSDPTDSAIYWFTYPTLGFIGDYSLGKIPEVFVSGKFYEWAMYVYAPDGGYGSSYWVHYISFDQLPAMNAANTVNKVKRDSFQEWLSRELDFDSEKRITPTASQ